MSEINLGACGCCGEPYLCGGNYCGAVSVTTKFTGTAGGSDPLRPCKKPCSIDWEKTTPFTESFINRQGHFFKYDYRNQWREWMSGNTPGLTASGSSECSTASDYFGSVHFLDIGCNKSVGTPRQISYAFNTIEPDAHDGRWRWEDGGYVWETNGYQSYPGFPMNGCPNAEPICVQQPAIFGQQPYEMCMPRHWGPQTYYSHNSNAGGSGHIDADFFTDTCEDFCGKTYTSHAQLHNRVYTSEVEFTFNCLP